jgi:beta-glucanase (GH16 family)
VDYRTDFLLPPVTLFLLLCLRLSPVRPTALAIHFAGLAALVVAMPILACCSPANSSPRQQAAAGTFDDEFNGAALDGALWAVPSRPGDASNNELECYSPSNAAVRGGSLVLTSRIDLSCAGHGYTSAMVQWRTFNFLYGRIEIRALEAGGKGTWPALWLLGADCQQTNITTPDNISPCNWPATGSDEIDITEIKGGDLTHVNEVLITSAGTSGCRPATSDVSVNWHIYTLDWQPGSLIWKIDGTATCSTVSNVPSHPMFLIMNTALGGNGGGAIDNKSLPQTHSIDYVRVNFRGPSPPPS